MFESNASMFLTFLSRLLFIAVALSLVSVGTAFYAMVYPAWFQQHYRRDGKDVYQGYGLFAFYSTSSLESPFYASTTVLQYTDFCVTNYITPNYMLGDGADFHDILCGKRMMAAQATTATGAAVSVVGLLTAIGAVFSPSAGYMERVVSFCTLVGCKCCSFAFFCVCFDVCLVFYSLEVFYIWSNICSIF